MITRELSLGLVKRVSLVWQAPDSLASHYVGSNHPIITASGSDLLAVTESHWAGLRIRVLELTQEGT